MEDLPEVASFIHLNKIYEKNGNTPPDSDTPYRFGYNLRPTIITPNYEFFIPEKVCWAHAKPQLNWGNYNRYTTDESELLEGFTCVDCGLMDPVSFKRCQKCGGAFYDLFRHPYQITMDYHYCWHCLEAGANPEINEFQARHGKLAPPERLLPPVVTEEIRKVAFERGEAKVNKVLSKPAFSFSSFKKGQ